MLDWQTREVFTFIAFGGKTFGEMAWPDDWERNLSLCGWEKDGGTSKQSLPGGKWRELPFKYFLSDKALYNYHRRER